ncbi:MAG: sulfatase-like hydrolase/transferase [Planctomycetota bacterium]
MSHDRPNVLMICTDHWPGSMLGSAGHPDIQTPTLDSLAGAGTRFDRAYTECPVCIPARRTLMTGTVPRTHGDRIYQAQLEMPDLPTLAGTFARAGYQARAVGKMHVYPQRDRVGFDDVILAEEARYQFGVVDDYQTWLGQQGQVGMEFAHGMCNNDYVTRPWHLPEYMHVTNWATREMCRQIKRHDPKRPGFYYLSYCHPHPPLAPLEAYLDMYDPDRLELPFQGDWVEEPAASIRSRRTGLCGEKDERAIRRARQAFYALATHIDHQLRLVIGTLRDEGLLGNTVVLFTSDHGDMLGGHRLWAKRCFYENSAQVPMILAGRDIPKDRVDHRLVGLADVMPTLLELAGVDVPDTVEGRSMLSSQPRDALYGEVNEDFRATRMIHDGRYKLIYYPVGNVVQLFDLQEDPRELHDLSERDSCRQVRSRLTARLIENLYGGDEAWARDGKLVGLPDKTDWTPSVGLDLHGQRGLHWPPPSKTRPFGR